LNCSNFFYFLETSMKIKYFPLAIAAALILGGCAPQTRTINYTTGVSTGERLSGRLIIRPSSDVPRVIAAQGTPRAKCAGRSYPGTLVIYKPEKGFAGEDRFGIDVIWPSGTSIRRNITVQVR
jgi:hypothetical protein